MSKTTSIGLSVALLIVCVSGLVAQANSMDQTPQSWPEDRPANASPINKPEREQVVEVTSTVLTALPPAQPTTASACVVVQMIDTLQLMPMPTTTILPIPTAPIFIVNDLLSPCGASPHSRRERGSASGQN